MAGTGLIEIVLLNMNYVFALLAIGVGFGGAVLFLREAMIDHRRHAAPRLSSSDLECYSFLDE